MSEFTKKKIQRTFWFEIFCKIKGEDNFIVTSVEVVVDKAFLMVDFYGKKCTYSETKAAVAYRDYLKNIAKIIRELINKYDIRKDRIMKVLRATAILLGIMVSSMFCLPAGRMRQKSSKKRQVEKRR